jgi:hypothetical protein
MVAAISVYRMFSATPAKWGRATPILALWSRTTKVGLDFQVEAPIYGFVALRRGVAKRTTKQLKKTRLYTMKKSAIFRQS